MKTPRNKNVKCVLVDEETVLRHITLRHTNLSKEEVDKMWKNKNQQGYWMAVLEAYKLENKLKGIEKRKAKALAKKVLKMAKEIQEAQHYLTSLCYDDTYGDGGILNSSEREKLQANKTVAEALKIQVERSAW